MKTMTPAAKRVMAARTALLFDEPFWGTLVAQLVFREDPNCNPPTAWTDGRTLGYHPDFIARISHDQIKTLLAHEVEHCARGHMWRRNGRDPRQWNIACDSVINPDLRDAGYVLPPGAVMELDPAWRGKSAEWVCDRMPPMPDANGQKPGQNGPGQPGGQPGPTGPGDADSGDSDPIAGHNPLGEVRDAPTEPDENGVPAPTESDWQQAVLNAAAVAKMQGVGSAAIDRLVDAVKQPAVDWRAATHRWAQELARGDFSWSRPNRRYTQQGLYMPTLRSVDMGPLAVAIDTSGSIDRTLLAKFETEFRALHDALKPRAVYTLYADAEITSRDEFGRDDMVTFKPRGGGGTDFRPVFDALDSFDEPPVGLIYLTDLYGTFPDTPPDIPVLWMTGERRHPAVPFGDVLVAEE